MTDAISTTASTSASTTPSTTATPPADVATGATASPSPSSPSRSAGTILREARQAQGVHIAALAASMKVAQKKLEALEADRFDQLPDTTFARALAQSVCRTLKIDAAPVLALLPQQQFTGRLEHVSEGINEPFRDHGGRRDDGDWSRLRSPAVWLPLLLLLAAVAVFMAPQGLMLRFLPASGAASGAVSKSGSTTTEILPPVAAAGTENGPDGPPATPPSMPSETASVSTSTTAPSSSFAASVASMANAAASTVSRVAAAASVEAAALAGVGPVQLHARSESWVEVQDARAKVLIGRALHPGETVFLDGPAPLRVKIGNAAETELVYRGRAVDLAASTRDNVARLELK